MFSRTGIVYNVTKSAVGVIVYKRVGNRYLEKRVNIRVEHVKHSKCRQEFLDRVKENARKRKEATEAGGKCSEAKPFIQLISWSSFIKASPFHFTVQVVLKRLPVQPREARHVSTKGNFPETIAPVAYETLI
jgi:large subunit ribosomal protein L21e